MTDFNSSPFENTITSKSTLVPSDHQLDYNDGDTIRFENVTLEKAHSLYQEQQKLLLDLEKKLAS